MSQTERAMLDCLAWLAYCLKIGWKVSQVHNLERLWWQYHDERGQLRSPPTVGAKHD